MKRLAWLILLATTVLWAQQIVTCPLHTYASCYNTYRMNPDASANLWHCSCGDDVWVAIDYGQ